VRAVSLHPDVLVVTSAVLQVNCVIVRGGGAGEGDTVRVTEPRRAGRTIGAGETARVAETFVIDSPVLPDELDALPALLEQAHFPAPSGLLATHGDWDHVLGRLAFPEAALGCAESTAERLQRSPGEVQRGLRAFDESLMISRPRPLALGSLQTLPIPGRCELGDRELELHPASGHTADGMAIWIPWARVLVVGDYLSGVEIPTLNAGGDVEAYLKTLELLRPLVACAERIVPGHGPVVDGASALAILEEDVVYIQSLSRKGIEAELPASRGSAAQRRVHRENATRVPQQVRDAGDG
jgi:glyoxylase-like metal-dependent hydrolase (beta-lactamase superfamily II)